MNESYDLTSIFNAIEIINNKQKKKILSSTSSSTIKKFAETVIPSDVDKIIKEAEAYKNKLILKTNPKSSTPYNESPAVRPEHLNNFKEIQSQIIEDLYSKLTKRVKKNTLKIIFNLHLKIQDLEKKLESFQFKKNQPIDKKKLILKDEVVMSLKKSDPSIDNLNKTVNKNKNYLKNEIVTSLTLQDQTISFLNEKIRNFKKTEESLRFQIIDLEQDKNLLSKKDKKIDESNYQNENINNMKEKLQPIYTQVEKQKKRFLALKEYSLKLINFGNELNEEKKELKNEIKKVKDEFLTYKTSVNRDLLFYKENYENLIIKNKDL